MTRFSAEIAADADGISQLTDQVSDFLDGAGVDARAAHHVALVLDEILTNVASHGGSAGTPATVLLEVKPDRVDGEIRDRGRPFDPKSAPEPDTSAPIEERRVGGLGLHLVRKLASTLDYWREGEQNWTRFCILRGQGPL